MPGIEVIRVGMGLEQIADAGEVFPQAQGAGRGIRPQIQQQILVDQQAGAGSAVLAARLPGGRAGGAPAKGQGTRCV